MQLGKYVSANNASINSYWAAIARAFGYSENTAPFNATPISGLWAQP
jgi:hypothetical protein